MGTARRTVVALGTLVAATAMAAFATAWSAAPACACGGGPAYDVYAPFTDLAGLVDFDGEGADWDAIESPHAFRFSFLAPVVLADSADPARRDERDDLSAIWEARSTWSGEFDLSDSTRARLSDTAFTAALRAGAFDRATTAAQSTVARALDMPAARAQLEQPAVQRAVEFLELRPRLTTGSGAAVSGPLLARFFALPPTPRDTPHVSSYYDSVAASRQRLRAWRRSLVARTPGPVPPESLPTSLREAAALRRMTRAQLAAAADRLPDSPRAPSLRFVALQERTRALVPDGWPSYDTTHVEQARAGELRALRRDYGAWLTAYPQHPLTDLVRLSIVRVDRLLDDSVAVWRGLLAEYPRHRGRVMAEMNFLLRTGYDPPAAVRATVTDPLLRSALLFHTFGCASFACSDGSATGYSHEAWDAEWRRAAAARPAAWAVNTQERLLRAALGDTSGRPLPSAFPARVEAPTRLWGTLRLALLVRAGRWADAEAQAAVLPDSDRAVAAFRMRLAFRHGQWSRALSEPALHPDTRRYFLHVLAPDSVLAAVAQARDTGARAEAVRAQAARLAAAGDWPGAARTARPIDPDLARRLGLTATLASDRTSAGRAALARHLVEEQDSLLGGADDRDWYRTVEGRWLVLTGDTSMFRSRAPAALPGVPWTPDEERVATRRFLRDNSELYLALGAYADALRVLPAPPAEAARRRALARAGDVPYNRLINRNYEYTVFWRRELARDSAVAMLRRAGRK